MANLLAIDERTVGRYLSDNGEELVENGYRVIRGKALQSLRSSYVDDIDVIDISSKTSVIDTYQLPYLDIDLASQYESFVIPLMSKIKNNIYQNRMLAKLCNIFLPK